MILIGGSPRTGTTLMLALMHGCGYDTGYQNRDWRKYKREQTNGMEYIQDKNFRAFGKVPYVVKHPTIDGKTVLHYTKNHKWEIDHLIFCIREVEDSVQSMIKFQVNRQHWNHKRRQFYQQQMQDPKIRERYAQSLRVQIPRDTQRFFIEAAELTIDPIIIRYPRYKKDFEYLKKKLGFIPEDKLRASFDRFVDPTR